jgi:transposase
MYSENEGRGMCEDCVRLRSLGKTRMLQTLTTALRLLPKRWLTPAEELKALNTMVDNLTSQHARRIRERFGVGPQTGAVMVAVPGDNPERLKNEAALAALCGTSQLQASSGKTVRHRLNRGGDHSANNALWTIAMVRTRSDPRTRAYVDRRTKEGLSNKEIHRCLTVHRQETVPTYSGRPGGFRRASLDLVASTHQWSRPRAR